MIINFDGNSTDILVERLGNDENICIPTDTIYGICASSNSIHAIKNIFTLKKRAPDKPLALLVNSIEMASKYFCQSKKINRLMKEFWPGSLTIIANKSMYAKSSIEINAATCGLNNIGIRYADNFLINQIISKLNLPIFATSVNFSNEPHLNNPHDINEQFVKKNNTDIIILDANLSTHNSHTPSTVISVLDDRIKIIREGAISEQIKKIT